eukprot:3599057-Pyramimonas_sp.AAC.1
MCAHSANTPGAGRAAAGPLLLSRCHPHSARGPARSRERRHPPGCIKLNQSINQPVSQLTNQSIN